MIGWWIVVSAQTPGERDRADQAARRAAILAQWEVGAGGIEWLHALVKAGKVEQHTYSGYPNRYTAQASEVLPLIETSTIDASEDRNRVLGVDESRGFVNLSGRISKMTVYADRMAACPAELLLTIDAWDQS